MTTSAKAARRALPDPPPSRAGTQSIQRATLLVRIIAARGRLGLRLTEVAQYAHLERSTTRRILKCLVAEGLAMQDAATHRYFLGPLVFELGLAAAPRFNIVDICRTSLADIAERHGLSVQTLRSQLKSVFAKTGARTQAQLMRLVVAGPSVLSAEKKSTQVPVKI